VCSPSNSERADTLESVPELGLQGSLEHLLQAGSERMLRPTRHFGADTSVCPYNRILGVHASEGSALKVEWWVKAG